MSSSQKEEMQRIKNSYSKQIKEIKEEIHQLNHENELLKADKQDLNRNIDKL